MCVKIYTMKKILFVLILLLPLQACQVILPTKVESLQVVLSPSISDEVFLQTKDEFVESFKKELLKNGYDVADLSVFRASTNIQATEMIETQLADIGFLTKLSYFENREDNLEVILTQTEKTYNLATDDLSLWNDEVQLEENSAFLDYHFSGIYLGSSVKGVELYNKVKQNQALTWIDLNSAKWCHILVTSQEGYIYPSLWLINNYSRRIAELFDHELVVKGYPELMERLAKQECDVVVGPDTLREEYASIWQASESAEGFARPASIYDEVKLVGLSDPILHDPVVYSTINEVIDENLVKAIQTSLINMSQAEIKNPLLDAMKVNGLVEATSEAYESFLPAYNYITSIFN